MEGAHAQLTALAELTRLLDGRGIDYWLFGGWAVDFHAGAVTRPHDDIDLAVWQADGAPIGELLTDSGWAQRPAEGGDGYTVYSRAGVRLELAFLARDADGRVYTPLRDGRAGWPDGAFGNDVANLHGARARVLTLEGVRSEKSQVQDDPRAAAKDRADLEALARAGLTSMDAPPPPERS